jgi:thioredoxin reductase (NADPH)
MSRRTLIFALGWAGLLILAAALAMHRSYSPGELLAGHERFGSNCAACHQPWQGVKAVSTGCVDCHGPMTTNPHQAAMLTDKSLGLIRGKTLVSYHNQLTCMSCHTDHRGRVVDMAATAGRNCAWCHMHDSIDGVGAHRKKPMRLIGASIQLLAVPFSHKQHLQDTIDHLQKTRQQVQRLRSPERKRQAQAEVAALTALLDSSAQRLRCAACHVVQPWSPRNPGKFSIAMAGCAISDCHSSWHDPALTLGPHAPQRAEQQRPNSPEPVLIEYFSPADFQFVKAEFEHSQGHLRSDCEKCHFDMDSSAHPGDFHSRRVLNCFACHAHQPEKPVAQQASSAPAGLFAGGIAMAAVHPPEPEKKVTACAECHLFHLNYKGTNKVPDFPRRAPFVRPHPAPGLRFAYYAVGLSLGHGRPPRLEVYPSTWKPWWLGLLGMLAIGFLGLAYVRYFPRVPTVQRARSAVAPQRTLEIPALDDSFQSSVRGLYVVGETAGTASINLAMRSGRQSIDFIASALKGARPAARPEVYDVAIVGCGPAGIGATTTAKAHGLSYIALEKTTAASTIRNYPRGKFVQSTPIDIREYGAFMMEGDDSKEGLVKKWEEMVARTQIAINEREEVTAIQRQEDSFRIEAASGKRLMARFVVLAIGVRGSPRKLNLAGEDANRVFYNLIEPEEYKDKRILIVGGGNAGAEVTQALAAPQLRNTVAYSFRDVTLGPPVTRENADKISALRQQGLITLYPASELREIQPGKVVLAPHARKAGGPPLTAGPGSVVVSEPTELDNDVIFAMLGAELPTRFMKSIGIRMTKKGH